MSAPRDGWPPCASLDELVGVRTLDVLKLCAGNPAGWSSKFRIGGVDAGAGAPVSDYVVDRFGVRRIATGAPRDGSRVHVANFVRHCDGGFDGVYGVDERSGLVVFGVGATPSSDGVSLQSIASRRPVMIGESVTLVTRPQVDAIRVERIVVDGADDWIVEGVEVGNRPQIGPGELAGGAFGAEHGVVFHMDVVHTAQDFVFRARYVGGDPAGRVLRVALLHSASSSGAPRRPGAVAGVPPYSYSRSGDSDDRPPRWPSYGGRAFSNATSVSWGVVYDPGGFRPPFEIGVVR